MSNWSQDAQSKDGKGMRDQDAGDPVKKCEERVKVIRVLDYNEATAVDPEVRVDAPPPPVEPSVSAEPPPSPIEHELTVLPPKKGDD